MNNCVSQYTKYVQKNQFCKMLCKGDTMCPCFDQICNEVHEIFIKSKVCKSVPFDINHAIDLRNCKNTEAMSSTINPLPPANPGNSPAISPKPNGNGGSKTIHNNITGESNVVNNTINQKIINRTGANNNMTFPKIQPQEQGSHGSGANWSNTKNQASSDNITVTIGIAIGIVLFVVLFIGFVVFYFKKKRKLQTKKSVVIGVLRDDVRSSNATCYSIYKPMEQTQNPSIHSTSHQVARKGTCDAGGIIQCDSALLALQLNKGEVIVQQKIGAGANGDVYLGRYKNTPVAVKKLSYELQQNCDRIQDFMEEIKIISRLDHPRVVKCYGAMWTNMQDLSAVMEYVDNGDLRNLIVTKKKEKLFSGWTDAKLQIVLDILEGLVYIHSMMIIHRDLKSRNVLLDQDYRAKLTDFGIARRREVWQESTMTGGIGTMFWMAPEVLLGSKMYNMLADIYSFGVILVELDTMDLPYANANVPIMEIPFRVSRNELRPEPSSSCPRQIKEIIDKCLAFEDSKRPTAIEIHHMWSSIAKNGL